MPNTTVSDLEADLESSAPHVRFVRGQWQVGIFDCGHHCIPNGWMACFFPCVSLAQISARFEPDSFRSVLIKQLVLTLLYVVLDVAYILLYLDIKKNFSRDHDFTTDNRIPYNRTTREHAIYAALKLLGCFIVTLIVSWLMGRSIAKLRTRVRERFRIPGSEKNDNIQATWCGTCAIAQMATQVKSYTPGSCGFNKPDELPAFLY